MPVVGDRADMVFIQGGTFRMGSDKYYLEEAPAHRVTMSAFWIDRTPVTNRAFRKFLNATGYVTFAEIPPDPKDYPGAQPHMLKAGSLVFDPPNHPVVTQDWSQWWTFKFGANWRRPYGPRSSITGLDDHPVVHVTHGDAETYARWVGKDLPTEAEFEFAARGGLDEAEFAWGDEMTPDIRHMANTWQGTFPFENLTLDGYKRTSPVTAFPPNGYGVYDMIGNVWEWTSDWYSPKHRGRRAKGMLHPRKSARRTGGCELRPLPAADQNSAQGAQGRFAFMRAELLPPLPTGRAAYGANRYVHVPRRVSMRRTREETVTVTETVSKNKIILAQLVVALMIAFVAAGAAWYGFSAEVR